MTETEIRALLAAAVAYDNRRPSAANIAAWHEAANRARWTFHAALDAIHAHYAESTTFLMPGHITTRLEQNETPPGPRPTPRCRPPHPPTKPPANASWPWSATGSASAPAANADQLPSRPNTSGPAK